MRKRRVSKRRRHDGVLKRDVYAFNAMTKEILKTDDKRKTETATAGLVYNFENIDGAAIFLEWFSHNVTFGIDRKISAGPAINVVSCDGGINVPLVLHFLARRNQKQSA